MTLSPALVKYLEAESWHRSETLVLRLGIPFSYRHVSFKSCHRTPAIVSAEAFVDDGAIGMVLQGGVGCGKTTAAVAAIRHFIEDDSCERVGYFTFGDFVARLLNAESRAETLDAAREADVLVIDDVGASFTSRDGFAVAMFEEVVIHREASWYSMLMTTNLAPGEFARRFGPRIFDRLKGSWGRWLNVDGPSLRRKARRAT